MFKKLIPVILFIIVSISSLQVLASVTPTVNSYLNKQFGSIRDHFVLTITVQNANSLMEPVLMNKDNFIIVQQSRSSKFIVLNNRKERSTTFTYVLQPTKTGTLKFGESYVTANGQRLYTRPVQVTISGQGRNNYPSMNRPSSKTSTRNKTPNKRTNNNSRIIPRSNRTIQQRSRINKKTTPGTITLPDQQNSYENFIFKGFIDNKEPFVNEQITYTLRILYRGHLKDLDITPPDFKNFLVEPLNQNKQYSTYENNQRYQVFEQTFALFPTEAGEIEIPSSQMKASFFPRSSGFGFIGSYNYRTINELSNPLKLNVLNLPPPPKEFENAVGKYSIDTKIKHTKVKAGETTELKITISGEGNILNIKDPEFKFDKHFKNNFKIYPKKPITQLTTRGDVISGQKIFNFDLVALKEGTYSLPRAEYAYFNPQTRSYHQLRSNTMEISVLPGATAEDLDIAGGKDALLNSNQKVLDDIISINTNPYVLNNKSLNKNRILIYATLLLIPILGVASIFGILKYQETVENNKEFIKKHLAYNEAKSRLGKLKKFIKQNNYKEFYYHLDNILKDYIGSKLYLPSKSLTSKDIELHLKAKGVSSKTILFTTEILSLCEKSEFASGSDLSKKVTIAFKDSKKMLKILEKELK